MGKSVDTPKDTVRERSEGCCEKCGVILTQNIAGFPEENTARSIHHRHPRRLGGKDSVINLVNLCNGCHRGIHDNEDQAVRDGWLIIDGRHPGRVPFLSHRGWLLPDSLGGLRLLDFAAGRAVVVALPLRSPGQRRRVPTRCRTGQRKSRKSA